MTKGSKSNRFKPLHGEELAVCRRVAQIRRTDGLSQAEFGERIRATRDQVVNIESGRVSLKWPRGLAICQAFNVSQLWLADGTEPIRPFFDLDKEQDFTMIPESMPFSAICKGPWLKNLTLRHGLLTRSQDPAASLDLGNAFDAAVVNCARAYAAEVPESSRLYFLDRLPAALRKLLFSAAMHPDKSTSKEKDGPRGGAQAGLKKSP